MKQKKIHDNPMRIAARLPGESARRFARLLEHLTDQGEGDHVSNADVIRWLLRLPQVRQITDDPVVLGDHQS